MSYQVVVLPRAMIQSAEAALWWAKNRSAEQAARWYDTVEATFDSLSENPERHPLAVENEFHRKTLRQVLFGVGRKPTHRALFHVDGETVYILAVRHVAQGPIDPSDL